MASSCPNRNLWLLPRRLVGHRLGGHRARTAGGLGMKNPFTANRAGALVAGILMLAAFIMLSARHPNAAMAAQAFDTAAGYAAATGPELWLIDFNGSAGALV